MTENKVKHAASAYVQVRIVEKCFLHMLLVQLSVYLCPWSLAQSNRLICTWVFVKLATHPYSGTLRSV